MFQTIKENCTIEKGSKQRVIREILLQTYSYSIHDCNACLPGRDEGDPIQYHHDRRKQRRAIIAQNNVKHKFYLKSIQWLILHNNLSVMCLTIRANLSPRTYPLVDWQYKHLYTNSNARGLAGNTVAWPWYATTVFLFSILFLSID